MPEYHRIKGKLTSKEFFLHPEPAAEMTLTAQKMLGVDAAILFTDLLPVLELLGLELDYQARDRTRVQQSPAPAQGYRVHAWVRDAARHGLHL